MKVALVELGGSHDECLYSQIKILQTANAEITLICTENLRERVENFGGLQEIKVVRIPDRFSLSRIRSFIHLRSYLISHHFTKVVLNTAQGSAAKYLLMLPFPPTLKFYGILHNTKKLKKSIGQKIISRKVKKYLVLNDYLLKSISEPDQTVKVESFYPIFFPKYDYPLPKPDDELWVAIPGKVEKTRRDYDFLLDTLAGSELSIKVKFLLLGQLGPESKDIADKINEYKLERYFSFQYSFMNNDLFHAYLERSDYVMPLVHPQRQGDTYLKHKITGSFNLAFAYRKPLLCSDEFAAFEDFQENAVFYSMQNLGEVLGQLSSSIPTPRYTHQKWTFDFQRKKLLKFLDIIFPE